MPLWSILLIIWLVATLGIGSFITLITKSINGVIWIIIFGLFLGFLFILIWALFILASYLVGIGVPMIVVIVIVILILM